MVDGGGRRLVLVVEDDDGTRELYGDVLTQWGYQVLLAADGLAALELLRDARPDVIVVDIQMPRLDGPGFVAAYRESPGPHAPIVVVSGTEATTWAERLGAAAHLSKPFLPSRLRATLGSVLS